VTKHTAFQFTLSGLAALGLAGLLACGGGGGGGNNNPTPPPPPPGNNATMLVYTNPNGATNEYRFEVSGGNNTSTITLELHGPTSARARGINFGLAVDIAKARFRQVDGSEYAGAGNVFELGSSPRLFKAVLDGGNLRVSMAQKGSAVSGKALNGTIATVSLQLQSGTAKGSVRLESLNEARVLLENGNMESIQVRVGSLTAQ